MADTYDHLSPEQVIRDFRRYATIDGVFDEDLYLEVLTDAVEAGEISEQLKILATYDPDDPRQKSGITPEAMTRARDAITVEGANMSVKDFAMGLGEGYYEEKQEELEKLANLFNKTFNMDIKVNKANLDMSAKIMLQHNGNADDIWREFTEASNYLIKSPGTIDMTIPLRKDKVNYFTDADGNELYLGLEEGDLNYILTSYYETHADTLRAYMDLSQKNPEAMTEEDLKMVADLEKAGGTMTLDDLSDKLEGGTNFNVFLFPTEDRKGITFRAYSVKDGSSMNPVSFELSALVPGMAITFDDLRERGMNRYKFEVVADMLEMSTKGTKAYIDERIEKFSDLMKGKEKDIKEYKVKRSGLNTTFFGTEEYPDTLLGWMQGLLTGEFFNIGPTSSDLSKLVHNSNSQFGERGIEFIETINDIEYWLNSKPRWGKVEVDYFQELLGDLPEDISDEDLQKYLRIEYNRLKADFDTWDKDFVSAMKQIPSAMKSTYRVAKGVLGRMSE